MTIPLVFGSLAVQHDLHFHHEIINQNPPHQEQTVSTSARWHHWLHHVSYHVSFAT